jgi:hypothetical protein
MGIYNYSDPIFSGGESKEAMTMMVQKFALWNINYEFSVSFFAHYNYIPIPDTKQITLCHLSQLLKCPCPLK